MECSEPDDRILILAPGGREEGLALDLLVDAGLDAQVCSGLDELCVRLAEGAAAVLVAAEALEETACRRLRELLERQPSWSEVPLLVATPGTDEIEVQQRLHAQLGENRLLLLLRRPMHRSSLVATARIGLSVRRRQYEVRDLLGRLADLNHDLELRVEHRTRALQAKADQVEALAQALGDAEQRERERIAHILHDEVQQLLVAIRLQSDALVRSLDDARHRRVLERVAHAANVAIEAARSLSTQLTPPALGEQGLPGALHWLVDQMKGRFDVPIELRAQDCPRISEGLRGLVFQACRELMLNALKHARASRIVVEVWCDARYLQVSVTDDGVGFDPGREEQRKSFGLPSIRKRLQLLGGRMVIDSRPGHGARVRLQVPYGTAGGVETEVPVTLADGRRLPHRVLIVDSHRIVRESLRIVLESEPRLRVVAEAGDGPAALEQAAALRPDVVLVDADLPAMTGPQTVRRLRALLPEAVIVGLSLHDPPRRQEDMLEAGAIDCVSSGCAIRTLIDKICEDAARSA